MKKRLQIFPTPFNIPFLSIIALVYSLVTVPPTLFLPNNVAVTPLAHISVALLFQGHSHSARLGKYELPPAAASLGIRIHFLS
jgi:hypothetical protein